MQAGTRTLLHMLWCCLFAAVLQAGAQAVAGSLNNSLSANAGERSASAELPESPGAVVTRSTQTLNGQDADAQTSAQGSTASGNSESQAEQNQPLPPPAQASPQRPVGTAAAESPDTSGIAASQPAGVAIAPAKQRRVRTLVLKVGALVGAGVAVGAVVALTAATPSRPPGAH